MKVIDNFLSPSDFELTQQYLLGSDIDWHYNDSIVSFNKEYDQFQFVHMFCNLSTPFESDYSSFLQPFLHKLHAKYIFRIKANCRPQTSSISLSPFHTDMDIGQQTAIFYLNTNDGYTLFEDGSKIHSVANRILTFDGSLSHCGTSCTDAKTRVVLNVNYIPS